MRLVEDAVDLPERPRRGVDQAAGIGRGEIVTKPARLPSGPTRTLTPWLRSSHGLKQVPPGRAGRRDPAALPRTRQSHPVAPSSPCESFEGGSSAACVHRVRHRLRPLARALPGLRRLRDARRGERCAFAGVGACSGHAPLLRLVDVQAEEAERISTGVRRARPRPRRRARSRLARARRRRARRRQVDAAPLGARRHVARAPGAARHRRGVGRAGEAPRRAPRRLRTSVEILAETELDAVCATLERERPDVCVIDSVQTLYSAELGSAPGSVAQVREAAARLLRVAKEAGVATFLVGHVTKDGSVAGPRVLEHLVDCVLQFEGDRYHAHRVLRAIKNRFGSTNELGVFEMTGAGPRRRARPLGALRPQRAGRGRRRGRLRARGNAAAPARDPVARRADRPGDAAARRRPASTRSGSR